MLLHIQEKRKTNHTNNHNLCLNCLQFFFSENFSKIFPKHALRVIKKRAHKELKLCSKTCKGKLEK